MVSLGHACNGAGRFAWADLCFDTLLRRHSHPAIAADIANARRLRPPRR
jgi:hypothetical protein